MRDLAWIDSFHRTMREYLFVREEDRILILPPNQVYKLNDAGLAALRHLGAGRRIARLPGLRDGERAQEVHDFFTDIKELADCDTPRHGVRRSVERIPYGFDYTALPILGEIAVTYRCTNACLFCYAGCGSMRCAAPGAAADAAPGAATDAASGGGEMSLEEVQRVIRVFRDDAKIPFFSFTGGEPTLRGDLPAMIRYAREAGLAVNLITNATLVDSAMARALAAAGLRTAQVSVESPDAAEHDGLTATPGSHGRTLKGIRALQEAGICVQTNTTLTARNAGSLPRLVPFLKGLGVRRFACNLFIPSGTGLSKPDLFLPYTAAPPLVEGLAAEAAREDLTFYWYSPLPHCIWNPIAKGMGNKSCAAMDGLLSVSPRGDVLPCSSWPEPVGNLLERPFRDIWFSPRGRFFKNKEYAPRECAGCEGFRACQAACPLYWKHAGTAELAARARTATKQEEVAV